MDKICLSIQLLLQFPNPDDPLDNNIAQVMKTDNKKFLKKAAEWTRLYAGRR